LALEEKRLDVEGGTVGTVATRNETSVRLTVYSDGSGTTGGPAGIGFVVVSDGLAFSEGRVPLSDATNQQAELLAATYALRSLPSGQDVLLVSDSRYVVKGFTKVEGTGEYVPTWRSRNWRKLGGGPIANLPLWLGIIAAVEQHRNVEFKWVRGHITKCPTCRHNGAATTMNAEEDYGASCGDQWHDHAEGNKLADRLAGEARKAARLTSESSLVDGEDLPIGS
jgi:ribonuclease HI